jgi:hypothetical protein
VGAGRGSGSWASCPSRAGGPDPDHARAADGRCVAEATLRTPAALPPGPGARLPAVGANSIRVMRIPPGFGAERGQPIAADGPPLRVNLMRWGNANPHKHYQLQSFSDEFGDFRAVQGLRVPHRVQAGNLFGTPEYVAFFDTRVRPLRFPSSSAG